MCLPRHGAEIKHPQPHHAPITRVGLATFHVGAALAAVSRSPQSRYIGRYSRHRFGNLVTGSFFFCASFAIGISGVWLLASAGPGLSHLPRCCLRGSFSPLRLSVILIYLSVLFCSVLFCPLLLAAPASAKASLIPAKPLPTLRHHPSELHISYLPSTTRVLYSTYLLGRRQYVKIQTAPRCS